MDMSAELCQKQTIKECGSMLDLLLSDSDLSTEVYNDFHLPDVIEGSYDILDNERMIVLRYLDFIPFIDRNYHTPIGYKYFCSSF